MDTTAPTADELRKRIEAISKHSATVPPRLGGHEDAESMRDIVRVYVMNLGDPARCKGCGATIWYIRHANGKHVPYTRDGLNHFADCPKAQRFRKKGK